MTIYADTTIILAIIGLINWLILFYKLPKFRWAILAVIFYVIHVLIFYISFALFKAYRPAIFWNNWSNIVRLQILLYILAGGLMVWYFFIKKEKI